MSVDRAHQSPDGNGAVLNQIPREECLALLRSEVIARVAVADFNAPPLIVPVNYVMDGDAPVFRTDYGTKFRLAVLRETPVSFEIDGVDPPAGAAAGACSSRARPSSSPKRRRPACALSPGRRVGRRTGCASPPSRSPADGSGCPSTVELTDAAISDAPLVGGGDLGLHSDGRSPLPVTRRAAGSSVEAPGLRLGRPTFAARRGTFGPGRRPVAGVSLENK